MGKRVKALMLYECCCICYKQNHLLCWKWKLECWQTEYKEMLIKSFSRFWWIHHCHPERNTVNAMSWSRTILSCCFLRSLWKDEVLVASNGRSINIKISWHNVNRRKVSLGTLWKLLVCGRGAESFYFIYTAFWLRRNLTAVNMGKAGASLGH